MEKININISNWILIAILMAMSSSAFARNDTIQTSDRRIISADSISGSDSTYVKKVLFIGDSMTGWMAERLNAYGDLNGFEVATVVWDGSTIPKWAKSSRLTEIINEVEPDAIMMSLGMNELFEPDPSKKLDNSVNTLKDKFGEIPFLWIGPPSWPGHDHGDRLNCWLEEKLGERNFFRSSGLPLSRQSKKNPHPSRQGIETWIDEVAAWIPEHSNLRFKSLTAPDKGNVSRGRYFIYRRMNETL